MIWSYLLILTPFIISPGASFNFTIINVKNQGFKGVYKVIIGTILGIITHILLVTFGISTILIKFPFLINTIRILGSVFLIFIAISMIKNLFKKTQNTVYINKIKTIYIANILNIKPVLLYLTIAPTIFTTYDSITIQYLNLGITHIVYQILWLIFLALIIQIANIYKLNIFIKMISLLGSLFLIYLGAKEIVITLF
ncbi:LysE family transporter [Mammaliicoccus sciuri]|uniref:LysE family translocator n=1 Tax=Mammaliicoccus TaxID=2803850 RepID=UPI001AAFB571|nr:LysE family transporter [Mammaliicoccus sciuri]MBO3081000.1 LysE family transporter [Mammaliicoccus sciuri]MCD8778002.1 LysE family transporter [Mammaliicoccus sciuri]MCD8779685.1 LysE family transporter [Mammaliicoccus sciuri]MCD8788783.1 LysE family transporter [Mammaliicoccus sciuri]MCO4324323.1 LysE family transporter [Mammaliicoccus sciuri]